MVFSILSTILPIFGKKNFWSEDLSSRNLNYSTEGLTTVVPLLCFLAPLLVLGLSLRLFLYVSVWIKRFRNLENKVKEQGIKQEEHNIKQTQLIKQNQKSIGKIDKRSGHHNELILRLYLQDRFGYNFVQGAKFVSILDAVQHVLARTNGNNVNLDERVKLVCSQIRDLLRPSNDANKAELVTGVQKDILLWYLSFLLKISTPEKSDELELKLRNFPWEGEDGKLSLPNVRKCISSVHENFKPTLAFLAQTIDWDDLDSFISSRAKKSKGKAVGHGFYFLMHFIYSRFCDVTNATAHEQLNFFPFPPSGEIELDAQGSIEIVDNTVNITIGEMKSSKGGIPKAKTQLKRSLVFFAYLHKFIADNDGAVAPMCYDLTGYIFIPGVSNLLEKNKISLPPLGKISYVMIHYSKCQ